MDEVKTVDSGQEMIYVKQCEDVAKMRASLLAFDQNDPLGTKKALQNITIMRVYHQIARIIRFTEMMDKIEDKMYQAIDATIDDMDVYDEMTWVKLANLQEKLQRSMIESHKLLEPYLNFDELTVLQPQPIDDPQQSFAAMIYDQKSRDKLRTGAQQVLAAIQAAEEKPDGE